MFNYGAIDQTPTVLQIQAIIKYMEEDKKEQYNFNFMMNMKRSEPNKISLDLNNAHFGTTYDILFNEENEIVSFKRTGSWMS
mgnify:CR=1 FL=1